MNPRRIYHRRRLGDRFKLFFLLILLIMSILGGMRIKKGFEKKEKIKKIYPKNPFIPYPSRGFFYIKKHPEHIIGVVKYIILFF